MASNRAHISELARAEERTALWLLAPTFIILILIAFFPLGRVFYSSFTNKRFASGEPGQIVGFQNYRDLLSVTIRELPPRTDAEGNVVLNDDGSIKYESWARILPREPNRYRKVGEFNFFGTRYVIGGTNAPFILAIWDTVIFTVFTVVLETVLGLIIALALSQRFFGRDIMRTAMLVPWAIITVVSSLIWRWMFKANRSGFFNTAADWLHTLIPGNGDPISRLLIAMHIPDGNTPFLTDPFLQMPSAIAIDVWKTTPFMALLLVAGLATIPNELYEAAEVDGASKLRQFFSLTLPLLMPTLAVALIFRTLDALRVFDLFQIIFGEARFSMTTFAQNVLVAQRDVGLSSAASVVIFIIIFAFAISYIRVLRVDSDE